MTTEPEIPIKCYNFNRTMHFSFPNINYSFTLSQFGINGGDITGPGEQTLPSNICEEIIRRLAAAQSEEPQPCPTT